MSNLFAARIESYRAPAGVEVDHLDSDITRGLSLRTATRIEAFDHRHSPAPSIEFAGWSTPGVAL